MARFHELLDLDLDDTAVAVTVEEKHLNPGGTVHGGLIATLADSAMGVAVRSRLGDDVSAVTVSMTVSFLEPARVGDRLRGAAEVRKQGKRILVAEVDVVRDSDDVAVAHAVATFTPVGG